MKNFKLTIEYDGTDYHGWQRQKSVRTVQHEIEKAVGTMTGRQIAVVGSGRTDAGVHALGQVANFKCATHLKPQEFWRGLNSLLPESIVIRSCEQVEQNFHARYDVKSKNYQYRILNRQLPAAIQRQYAWHIRQLLDLEAMNRAAAHLVGRHDFTAFEGTGSRRSNAVRHVVTASFFRRNQDYLVFGIEADGFLRFMVRNIVGTLVEVGKGKISPQEFAEIIGAKNRSRAGATAPALGLFLVGVKY
ncbi:MAG: tRNA pseudouridine(38-40) synthase TruA [Desulfobacterales bacterium]|jgi:tRNA pseudouridine38-40 synthase